MNYYIDTVTALIQEQLSQNKNGKTLIRLENFNSLDFYFQLGNILENFSKENNIQLLIKLSKNKFEYFKEDSPKEIINSFIEKNWVDTYNQMTLWRNEIILNSSLVLLLGTEEIEDRGGLEDFFKITPETLDLNIKENYHKIFEEKFSKILAGNEKIIDSFYRTIFSVYPKNIFKISSFVDSLNEKEFFTMDKLIEKLFSSLYEWWGIPNFSFSKILSRTHLKNKNKIKELETAINFKERKMFRNLSNPQLAKFQKKIEEYKSEEDFSPYYSYEDLSSDLINYIVGRNIEVIKENLFQVDFNIIKNILDLKITTPKSKTIDKTIYLKGEPIFVFYEAINQGLKNYLSNKDESLDISNIYIDITEVGVANCGDGEERENTIYNFWNNLCKNIKGLKTFINKSELFKFPINYYEKDEFFEIDDLHILKEKKIITKLSPSKSYSHLDINIIIEDVEENRTLYKFQWKFTSLDSWFMNFSQFTEDFLEKIKAKGSFYIPIFEMEKIDNLSQNSNDGNEFFNFIEKNQSNNSYNILESHNIPEFLEDDLIHFGKMTFSLINDLIYLGFYNLVNNNLILDYINKYKKILNLCLKEPIEASEMEKKEFFRIFLYAFTYVNNYKSLLRDEVPTNVLTSPLHPALLEKLSERLIFIKDALEDNSPMDKITNLTTIDSTLDILLGKDSYLITKKSFGNYSLMTPFKENDALEKRLDFNSILKRENALTEDNDSDLSASEKSKYFQDIVQKYIDIFPSSMDGLKLGFINPEELEPIVKCIWDINNILDLEINISLYIYIKEENIGGKSYFVHWINALCDKFKKLQIQVYYTTHCDLDNLNNNLNSYLPEDMDIIFISEALTDSDLKFSEVQKIQIDGLENKFPMVYKPLPFNSNNFKREIEITQNQFQVATLHSKLINKYKNNINSSVELEKSLLKEFKLKDSMKVILSEIKKKGNWIVSMDKGIDKQLLQALDSWDILSITTGKGNSGELNIVIGAGRNQLENIKNKLENRITHLFSNLKYTEGSIDNILKNCFDYIHKLDGINILKTMSLDNTQINNYIGYLMTYMEMEKNEKNWGLIPLDLYTHWFNGVDNRPDYLGITYEFKDNKLYLTCNIIECKVAKKNQVHINKASDQIKAGYSALMKNFDPKIKNLEKRYWLLQLYKAFVYCMSTNNDEDYTKLTEELFLILNGEFEINWKGSVYTYWLNGDDFEKRETSLISTDFPITHYEFPKNIFGKFKIEVLEEEERKEKVIPTMVAEEIKNTTYDREIKNRIKNALLPNNNIEHLELEREYANEMLIKLCKFYNEKRCEVDPGDFLIGPSIIRLRIKLPTTTSFIDIQKKAIDLKLNLRLDKNPHIFPDKDGFVSIDIPRKEQGIIRLEDILPLEEDFKDSLKFILGINEEGKPIWVDLSDSNTTHLLVAGASGGGKSVLLNSIIINIMSNYTPDEVKFIFIDPKYVEMGMYNDSPFLYREIITDIENAIETLEELTQEMDERYKEFAKYRVKDIASYNKIANKKIPRIVVVFDEYADFMEEKEYREDLEKCLKRITQKARAAGIHIIISTQTPKSEIITTTIRNNLSARIALKVNDANASRIILDESGAENLLGKGDMFFKNPNEGILNRLKSPYIPTEELDNILLTLKECYKTNE